MRYKGVSLFFFIFFAVDSLCQTIDYRRDSILTFNHFLGIAPSDSKWDAQACVIINKSFGYNATTKMVTNINILNVFDCSCSYMRVQNDLLLMHEQGHFNLNEWKVRQLRMMLSTQQFDSIEEAIQITNKIKVETQQLHDLYDNETAHGINITMQFHWNNLINNRLNLLSKYK